MTERFSDQAVALIENVLLFRLGQSPTLELPPQGSDVGASTPEAGALSLRLDEVLQRFEARYGRLRWIHGPSRSKELFFARLADLLRHRSSSRLSLARKVVDQAVDHGLDQVLSETSTEARKFTELAREVRTSLHRLLSQTILIPDGSTLVAYIEPHHRIADLIARELGRRHRGQEVLIVTPDLCYQVGRAGFVTVTDPVICRTLRHRALSLGQAERYWQRTTARA